MKAIKYLAVGALLTVLSAPVQAQVDSKAAIDQVEQILNSKAADADKQIKGVAKKFKKDAATLTEIGKMYMFASNYDKAKEYAEMALAASKNKFGGAYVLLGDLAAKNDDGGKAAEWYQNAQYFDPANPDGYIRYAYLMRKSGLSAALGVLETLKQNNPDYDINVISAEICMSVDNKAKAYEFYKKADLNKMTEAQILNYAKELFDDKRFEESCVIAEKAMQRFPQNEMITRLAFYGNVKAKNFEKGLEAANKLNSLGVKMMTSDFQNKAEALEGLKRYDEAVAVYNDLYKYEDTSDAMKAYALKSIATVYTQSKDFKKAIEAYKTFINFDNNVTANDYKRLQFCQVSLAQEVSAEEKAAVLAEAEKTLEQITSKFEGNEVYAYYQRATIALSNENSELAKKHYDDMISFITSNNKVNENKDMLQAAYFYNMVYFLQTVKDKEQAKAYANLILELDPTNETAAQVAAMQ